MEMNTPGLSLYSFPGGYQWEAFRVAAIAEVEHLAMSQSYESEEDSVFLSLYNIMKTSPFAESATPPSEHSGDYQN
jgi:hypothetical protein